MVMLIVEAIVAGGFGEEGMSCELWRKTFQSVALASFTAMHVVDSAMSFSSLGRIF